MGRVMFGTAMKEILCSKENIHVLSIKTYKKARKAAITYWAQDEAEDDGEDVSITIFELLADYVTYDVKFLNVSFIYYQSYICVPYSRNKA